VDEYEVTEEEARSDLHLFLKQLENENLMAGESEEKRDEGAQG
jgi:hypothetical protein